MISHGLQRNYLSPLADQCAWSGGVLDRRGDSHYGRSDERVWRETPITSARPESQKVSCHSVTVLGELNLTLRQRTGRRYAGARFAGGYHGEADTILCSTEFQTTEEAGAAPRTTGQDHRVPKCFDQKVGLDFGENDVLRVSTSLLIH